MKAYLRTETAYIGPFSREFILENIEKYVETAKKYVGGVKQDWQGAGICFGVIINGSLDGYYLGLWIEMSDSRWVLDVLLEILKMMGVDVSGGISVYELSFTGKNVFCRFEDFVDTGKYGIRNGFELIDNVLNIIEKYSRFTYNGMIMVGQFIHNGSEELLLDINLSAGLKLPLRIRDFKYIRDFTNEMYRATNIACNLEFIPLRRNYALPVNLLELSINMLDSLETEDYRQDLYELYRILSNARSWVNRWVYYRFVEDLAEKGIDDPSVGIEVLHDLVKDYGLEEAISSTYTLISRVIDVLKSLGRSIEEKGLDIDYLDQLLETLNDVALNIKVLELVSDKYEYLLYHSREDLFRISREAERVIISILDKVNEAIHGNPPGKVYEYLVSHTKFYVYVAGSLRKYMVDHRKWFMRRDHAKLAKVIYNLGENIYYYGSMPLYSYTKGETATDIELVRAYKGIFKKDLVYELDEEILLGLLDKFRDELPKEFVEEAEKRLLSSIGKRIEEFLVKDNFDKVLEELKRLPKNISIKLINRVVWPNLKKHIDSIASRDPVEAVAFIERLLENNHFRFLLFDSPLMTLKRKLNGKLVMLRRRLEK